MRIEVMLTAKSSSADSTSVSTMIDLDTRKPGWEHGLVQTVTNQASAGAEHLREHLGTSAVPATLDAVAFEPTIVPRARGSFIPPSEIVPSATVARRIA